MRLACPTCRAFLDELDDALRCLPCRRRFPIVDGVPDLLVREEIPVEQASVIADWESGADEYLAWLGTLPVARTRPIDRPLLAAARGDVLEVGCGDGRLLGRVGGPTVGSKLGVDPSRPLVSAARRRGLRVALARAEQLPLADRSVDTVISGYYALRYTDLDRALGEIGRVLRPGGRFAFTLLGRNAVWLAGRIERLDSAHATSPNDVASAVALRGRLARWRLRVDGLLGTPYVPRLTAGLGRLTGGRLPYLRGAIAVWLGFDVIVVGHRE